MYGQEIQKQSKANRTIQDEGHRILQACQTQAIATIERKHKRQMDHDSGWFHAEDRQSEEWLEKGEYIS